MSLKNKSPQEVPDIKVKDPVTGKEMVVEGEHYELNKGARTKKIEPFKDANGVELSDRIVAKLAEEYSDFPDNYNGRNKSGEADIREVGDLIREKQWYQGEDGFKEYIIRSYDKKYKPVIERLRNIQQKGQSK